MCRAYSKFELESELRKDLQKKRQVCDAALFQLWLEYHGHFVVFELNSRIVALFIQILHTTVPDSDGHCQCTCN